MKKIAIISILKNIGGIERSLTGLLHSLNGEAVELTLILPGEANGELKRLIPDYVTVINPSVLSNKEYIIQNAKSFKLTKLVRFINALVYTKLTKKVSFGKYLNTLDKCEGIEERFDVAICWALPDAFQTMYTLKKVNAEKKLLWIHMDLKQYHMPKDTPLAFDAYDKLICVSNACKKSLVELYEQYEDKTEVFYNFVDTDEITQKAAEEQDIVNNDEVNIVTCGRLAKEKRPEYSVDIVKNLISKGIKNFKWIFIGDGPLAGSMISLVKENGLEEYFVFTGTLLNPYSIIGKCDLYIQLSHHESFCLSLLEAQLLNIPAVSTHFPSSYEIIDDGKTGLIADENISDLSEKTAYLIENSDIRESMKKNLMEKKTFPIGDTDEFMRMIGSIKEE